MGSMIDFWGDLGATAGRGVEGYAATTRLLEERDRQRRQQDEDRRRTMALQEQAFAQQEGQQAFASGNYSLAALAAQKVNQAKNEFDGGKRVGMQFIGTYGKEGTGQEQARPTPAMQGPMPEAQRTTYDANTPDWKNPANVKGLAGMLALPPQSFELSPGQSRYSIGPDGKPQLQVTAPIPDNPYKMRADVQEELRRLGYTAAGERQDRAIAAADHRQQVGIAATNARQKTALGAADAKTFTASVNALAAKYPGIQVTSGQRSAAEQQALWEKDLRENGGKPSGRVARPGQSAHETGLARDVYVPPAQRAAFIAEAQAQGFYVKADYPDGHIHIAVPQGVRPAAPPKAAEKLVTKTNADGTQVRVRDGVGVDIGKKPATVKPPKPWSLQDEKTAQEMAAKAFPAPGEQYGAPVPPATQAKRDQFVATKKREHATAQRQASGQPSALETIIQMMEEEKKARTR